MIDFYTQFLEAKYLDQQFNQFLVAFKTNPLAKVSKEDSAKEHELAVGRMRKYFMNYYVRCFTFLFKETNKDTHIVGRAMNVFEYYDKHSELFFSTLVDIYMLLAKGLSHVKLFDVQNTANLPGSEKVSQNMASTRNY